ncbi:hypothetical protein HDE_01691 [Halotydeus destructor]|nr:hypothetical protein HDE_01691 [Halotydeus destructor]
MSVEDEIGLSDRETVCDMDEAEMKERHEFENIDKALEPLGLFRTAQETAENMESPLDEYSITGDSTGESGTPHEPMDHSDDEINPVDAAQYSLSLSKPQGPKPMPKSVLRRNLTKLLFNWDADTIKPPKPTGVCKFFHFFSPKQVVYRDHEGLLYDCSVNRRAYRELLFAKSEKIKTEKDSVDAMEAGVEEDLPVNLEELNHDFNFTCYCCSFGTPQQSKIKRNYKFKTFGEFKKQMMCQVNKELAKHAGSSSTESMNHRGLIVSFAQNGRSSILCCKVPRDSSESGNRFQAGILLSICLESNNAITLVGTVFDTHPEVEEDGGRNIYDIVSIDGYTTNSVEDWPAVECSIRRLCNINCTKLKMTAIYELSKAVPKHVEFYSPRLKSTNNGIVQVRVSENTKKNFEGNREFYINCLQKAVDTLLVSYQDISRFCVFDDRSDRHLLILAIEIVRQVFLLFEDINNYKRGIWPGDVKKEDPDIEAKKAIAIEPLRLIVTSGKEESLFLILEAIEMRWSPCISVWRFVTLSEEKRH